MGPISRKMSIVDDLGTETREFPSRNAAMNHLLGDRVRGDVLGITFIHEPTLVIGAESILPMPGNASSVLPYIVLALDASEEGVVDKVCVSAGSSMECFDFNEGNGSNNAGAFITLLRSVLDRHLKRCNIWKCVLFFESLKGAKLGAIPRVPSIMPTTMWSSVS